MQGNIAQYPLVEVIREIISDAWSGALRLSRERVRMVFYFERGAPVYAACNLKQFKLADCLRRAGCVGEAQLRDANAAALPDAKLAQTLLEQGAIDRPTLDSVLTWQAGEMLKLALNWPDGEWQLEARVRPAEKAAIKTNLPTALLEAARQAPPPTVKARLAKPELRLRLGDFNAQDAPLTPAEAFVLSRLAGETGVNELLLISGLPENETARAIYALAAGGFLQCEGWHSAFSLNLPTLPQIPQAPAVESRSEAATSPNRELETFLTRMEMAKNYYQMLGVERGSDARQLKDAYYRLARKFHPDLFRTEEASLHSRIETEFTRVTRAYETLKDDKSRGKYDSTLPDEDEFLPETTLPPTTAKSAETPAANLNKPPLEPAPKPAPPATPPVTPPPASTSAGNSRPVFSQPVSPPMAKPADTTRFAPFMARDEVPQDASARPKPVAQDEVKITPQQENRAADYFQRGLAALASRDRISAVSCLAESVRLNPRMARYHAYFGAALAKDPNARRQAESEIREAIRLEPANLDFQVMLAEFFWTAGFPLRAQGELKRILERDPFHQEARSLRDQLSSDTLKN